MPSGSLRGSLRLVPTCNAHSSGQEVFGEYHGPFGGPEEEYGGQARVSGIRALVALVFYGFLNV